MIFNETEEQERAYLRLVIGLLRSAVGDADSSVREHVDTLAEYKDYLWSNKDIDPHEIRSMRESILNHFALGQSVIERRQRLARILDIPYFGRIDFRASAPGVETGPIYIGVHTFYDPVGKTNLIHDWRAPISGMFYDHELGSADYESPSGRIEGDITLKRQYRIRGGRMEYMIESSLTVHDEVLQRELSSNADDRMKNIVATIQREQNRIIRNSETHTLIIQGVAGSGKTSIAMHRIAYLLYAFKGEITSGDILIVSPNRVFADYISNVLPELGEQTVPTTGMEQILSGVLGDRYRHLSFFDEVDELLGTPSPGFVDRIRHKASFGFAADLDRFILYVENTYFRAADVKLSRYITIPAEFIDEQFRRFDRYPMRRRFEPMADYILEIALTRYGITVAAAERNMLKREIKKMFAGSNNLGLYRDFYAWIGAPAMFRMRRGGVLEYADLAPLAYLHLALEGSGAPARVKHLLIDEMQDYTPIQYRVIQKLYPCRKTVLGDAAQSVNPYGSTTADMIRRALGGGEVIKLCKSYRSTCEITGFARSVMGNRDLEPVARHGERPRILKFANRKDEICGIADQIRNFRESEYQSLGIICKTESQARELAGRLDAHDGDLGFLSSRSSSFGGGMVVTSAHMAKGLEFDQVIVAHVDADNYRSQIDRSMLYVAVTRAMHSLTITYSGETSPLLAGK